MVQSMTSSSKETAERKWRVESPEGKRVCAAVDELGEACAAFMKTLAGRLADKVDGKRLTAETVGDVERDTAALLIDAPLALMGAASMLLLITSGHDPKVRDGEKDIAAAMEEGDKATALVRRVEVLKVQTRVTAAQVMLAWEEARQAEKP